MISTKCWAQKCGHFFSADAGGICSICIGRLKLSKSYSPVSVIESFLFYMDQEGTQAHRAEFVSLLQGHLADKGFCSDTDHLLLENIAYDPHHAGNVVEETLLSLLPDGP